MAVRDIASMASASRKSILSRMRQNEKTLSRVKDYDFLTVIDCFDGCSDTYVEREATKDEIEAALSGQKRFAVNDASREVRIY